MAVTFHFNGRTINALNNHDQTILELARNAGLHIDAKCGGKGSCGQCNVLLSSGRYRVYNEEITVHADQRREVLACQTYALEETAEIFLPRTSIISFEDARIVDEMDIPAYTFSPHFLKGYGVAVDLGTTTVVAALINLRSGQILDRQSLYNQQILKADDIVSRISFCNDSSKLETLKDLIINRTLNPLINRLCLNHGIDADEIMHIAIAGNTVMTHIFFGISPVSIGVIPFTPVSRTFEDTAIGLGLSINPNAIIEAVPAIAGYIGGDITADLYVSEFSNNKGLSLLVDIGTNGEIAACLNGEISACATAAGPAFEGAGLLHGARAICGAIDTIRYDESLKFNLTIIGNSAPIGLCGSAIIDFIAEGFRCGLISMIGRYDVEMLQKKGCYQSVNGMNACQLVKPEDSATGEAITVTENDIAEILKAKAAIYSGIKTLLAELGKRVCDLDKVVLAGGFARHIRLESAFEIGMLPAIGVDKYDVIGNGALAGAALILLDKAAAPACRAIIEKPKIINLNQTVSFTSFYQEAIVLPNLIEDEFPRSKNAT